MAYGARRDEVLRRLAHPLWFQSFGAVMGMDWHSPGITTSVVGALERGLGPVERELGLRVCGGRGRHSRKRPARPKQRLGRDGGGTRADQLSLFSREPAELTRGGSGDGESR